MSVNCKSLKTSFVVSKEKSQEFLSQKSNGGFKRSLETFRKHQKTQEIKNGYTKLNLN